MSDEYDDLDLSDLEDYSPTAGEDDPMKLNPAANMSEAVKINPTRHARNMQLGKDSGLPTFAVAGDPDAVEKKLQYDNLDLSGLQDRAPKTAEFLSEDFDGAVLAQNDVGTETLQKIEGAFEGFGTRAALSFENVYEATNLWWENDTKRMTDKYFDDLMAHESNQSPEAQENLRLMKAEASSFSDDEIAERTARVAQIEKEIQAATPENRGVIEEGVISGLDSAVQMIPIALSAIVTRGASTPAMLGMFAQTHAASYASGLNSGLDHDTASTYATIDGVIEVATEKTQLTRLEKMLTGKSTGMTKDAIQFLMREMFTEQLATGGQSLNAILHGIDEEMNHAETLEEKLLIQGRRQLVTAIATPVGAGAQVGSVKLIGKLLGEGKQIEQQVEADTKALDEIHEQAEGSEMRKLNPEAFQQFVKRLDGDKDAVVYIDALQASLYLRERTESEITGDRGLTALDAALVEANENGTDVVLPVEVFTTEIAGGQVFTDMREHISLNADMPSQFRMTEEQQELDAFTQRIVDEADKNSQEYQEAEQIYRDTQAQLVDSGAYSPEVAKAMATVMPAYITARAKRLGKTVREVAATHDLTIEGMQTGEAARLASEAEQLQQASASGFEGENAGEAREWTSAVEKGLDMSQESRMSRAAEMGFDTETVYYHGSAKSGYVVDTDITAFDKDKIGDRWSSDNAGFFFTSSQKFASDYASADSDHRNEGSGNGVVYPTYLKMENPLIINDEFLKSEGMEVIGVSEDSISFWDNFQSLIFEWVENGDHDGVVLHDGIHSIQTGVVFDPSNIRSTNAAFDPDFKDSSELLAQSPVRDELTLDQLSTEIQQIDGVKTINLFESGDHVKLDTIIIDKDSRKAGVGSDVMNRIIAWADQNNKVVTLSPAIKDDFQGTTSRGRLVKFYKRFGFVENKGRNKDFEISEGMYRTPEPPEQFNQSKTSTLSHPRIETFNGMKLRKIPVRIKVVADSAFADEPSKIHGGIYEIPLAGVSLQGDQILSKPSEVERINELADTIGQNRVIEPLIVAKKADGSMYVAEGQHRARALIKLGFNSIPAKVVEELPPEQFNQSAVDQTETPEFKAWSGGGEVVESEDINDHQFEDGKPTVLKVFHGTTHEFNEFDATLGEQHGHFGAVNYFTSSEEDASENYAGVGPDLTSRINQRAEQLENEIQDVIDSDGLDAAVEMFIPDADQFIEDASDIAQVMASDELDGGDEKIMEVYVKTEKPFIVGGTGGNFVELIDYDAINTEALEIVAHENDLTVEELQAREEEFEEEIIEARDGIFSDTENPLIEAINEVAVGSYNTDGVIQEIRELEEGANPQLIEQILRESEGLRSGEQSIGQVISEVIQHMGYDAIVLKKANIRFNNMNIPSDTAHVHVFDAGKTNIKSVDNRGTFNSDDANIYNQNNGDVRGYYSPSQNLIRLTEAADLSTFLHEFAHFAYEQELREPSGLRDDIHSWFKRNAVEVAAEANGYLKDKPTDELSQSSIITKDNMYEILLDSEKDDLQFHGSHDGDLNIVTDGDNNHGINFGGIFTSGVVASAESHGPELYAVVIEEDKKAREGGADLDDIDRDVAIGLAAGVFTGDREQLAELVEHAIDDDDSSLPDAEDSWNLQRLRGLIAKELGYSSVEMRDEHGVSTLVLSGVKLHKIQDEQLNQSDGTPAGGFGEISPELVATYLDNGTTGDPTHDAAIRRAVHEQFARGFEAYLMEGKAPNAEMRSVFQKFTRWLTEIYKSMKGLNVNLDDEAREVFDRLIATDEQIEQARARGRIEPMFTDATMAGMTEGQYAKYLEKQEASKDKQIETLRDKMLKALTNRTQKWWKAEKADIIEEEIDKLQSEKVYTARTALTEGAFKLDTATVKERVGEERTNKLGHTAVHIPSKLRGMTAKGQKGIHPDEAAAFLGYSSGAELLSDLISSPTIREAADERAEAIMVERHGDVLNDGSIEREADEAVHDESRGKLILSELKQLTKGTNVRAVELQAVKDIAREKIGKLNFRQIKPETYRRAEIRMAQQSAKLLAEGDKEGAALAKKTQVMNHWLAVEATKAKADITKTVDFMARYRKAKVKQKIQKAGADYWEHLDKILSRFQFKKTASLVSVAETNQGIEAWMNDQVENHGAGLALANVVLDETIVTHWKEISYSDLQGVKDSVKNIEHVATYSEKLKTMGEEIRYEKHVTALLDAAEETGTGDDFKVTVSKADDPSWAKDNAQWAMAQMTKIPFLASWMEGGSRNGIWASTLVKPFTEALDNKFKLYKEVGEPVMDMIKNRDRATVKRHNTKVFIPEIVGSADGTHTGNMMGHEILAVALNVGNEGNLRKLLLGEGWADINDEDSISIDNPKLQAVLAHMTETDWQMVQKIWDQIDILYPKLEAVHRETTGLSPAKVMATPVETPFGTFSGGYYPVKYDPRRSRKAADNQARTDAETESMFNMASIQASVNASATNERTGYYAPMMLSMDVVPNHIDETIHYITHHAAIRETNKLLRDPRVKAAVTKKLGPHEYNQLLPWLNDVAKDGRIAPNRSYINSAWNQLRLGTTLGVMGFKASTGIIQISGLSNSAAETGFIPTLKAVGMVVGRSRLINAMRRILGSDKQLESAWEFAAEHSKVMSHRAATMDREILNAMNTLSGRRGAIALVQETSMKHIALIQTYMVDLPTWHAAYAKELGESGDHDKAVQAADWTVENVQGSGATKDMASLMRSQTKTHTIFTMFMTYFSALWNLQRDAKRGHREGNYSTSGIAAKAMFLYAVPVLFEMVMRGELGDEDDEPEEQLAEYMVNLALFPIQSMPFVRDVVNGVTSGYGYNASPVTSQVEKGLQGLGGIAKALLTDGEITQSQVKNSTKLIGATFGVPATGQIWATSEHVLEVLEEGEDFSAHSFLFGPERN